MLFRPQVVAPLLVFASIGTNSNAQLINEYQPNPPGSDSAQANSDSIELKGPAGQSFEYCYVNVECDDEAGNGGPGRVDELTTVSGTYNANGLTVVVVDPNPENPSHIIAIVEGSCDSNSGLSVGTFLTNSPFSGTTLDAIAVVDEANAAEAAACEPTQYGLLGGQIFAWTGDEPKLVFRDGITNAWYAVNDDASPGVYDINGNEVDASLFDKDPQARTYGEVNPTIGGSSEGTGDPHFKTWNSTWFDFHGICDLVLLDNPGFQNGLGLTIHIRTKARYQYSYIESAALRIGQDTLEVSSWGQYFLNGVEGAPMPAAMAGLFPLVHVPESKKHHSFVLSLDEARKESITIRTFKDLVSVHFDRASAANFGHSEGILGNFASGAMLARDGSTVLNNDVQAFGQEWQVLPTEPLLFQAPSEYLGKACVPPSVAKGRRLGEAVSQEAAEMACAHHKDAQRKDMCIFDVMAMGDLELANTHGAY